MKIEKLGISIEKQAELECAEAVAARTQAALDYNIMMGNLDDPAKEDEENE